MEIDLNELKGYLPSKESILKQKILSNKNWAMIYLLLCEALQRNSSIHSREISMGSNGIISIAVAQQIVSQMEMMGFLGKKEFSRKNVAYYPKAELADKELLELAQKVIKDGR